MSGAPGAHGSEQLSEARLRTAVRVAGDRGTGIELSELRDLLPTTGISTEREIAAWFEGHRSDGAVVGDAVFPPGSPGWNESAAERRQRGVTYLAAARELVDGPLAPVRPLLLCAGVTGSTAYGEPEAGEDCDVFAVTRDGSLWVFLTYLYLKLRLRPPPSSTSRPSIWCFNYAMDRRESVHEFSEPRGFLFAREALVTKIIRGEPFYRQLLSYAPWLREEAPRLYARWEVGGLPVPTLPADEAAPLAIRLLNGLLFLGVGAYLQAVGLIRNRALRLAGRAAEAFRTFTSPHRLAVQSVKFDRLIDLYGPSSVVSRRSWSSGRGLDPDD